MDYLLHNTEFDLDSPNAQDMLNAAHKVKQRPLCRCTLPMPEMYVARIADKFVIKRMPDTGPDHAPSCSSFLPPDELSGLSQVHGTAFEENPDDGTTLLRLGFPLSIRGKASAPPPSVTKASEVKSPDRKLTLTSLLHFLWHEADLTKWIPAMTGKRSWWVIQRQLKNAAMNKIAKQQAFDTRLFVPENFRMDYKDDIAARRNSFFTSLSKQSKTSTALGVLVAEYKTHEETPIGARFTFKHMPDCSFFADKEFLVKFTRIFEEQLMLSSMLPGSHIMIICTFSMAKAGYPIIQDMGMMLTTKNWVPFEHMREVAVIDAMTKENRSFAKSLRFNLDRSTPIASMIATDTVPPTALYVSAPSDSGEDEATLIHVAEEGTYPTWIWSGDGEMPELPQRTVTDR